MSSGGPILIRLVVMAVKMKMLMMTDPSTVCHTQDICFLRVRVGDAVIFY